MKFVELQNVVLNVPDTPHSMFPGMCRNQNGDLILECSGGSEFEGSDSRMFYFKSSDNGKSWQYLGPLFDLAPLNLGYHMTASCKPTLLADGSMLSVGYGFLRDRPEMGLSDYAAEFGHFPKIYNFCTFSTDNGENWSTPEFMSHQYDGMEFSGPALQLNDGTLLAVGAPFVLQSPIHQAVVMASTDGGKNWTERAQFFRNTHIAPWEIRTIQLASGRIIAVIWAFDLKAQKHLNTQIVFSDDNGFSWSEPIDTGLRAQASNWVIVKDQLMILQARREGNAPGIYLNAVDISDGKVQVGEDIVLFDAAGCSNAQGSIEQQFAALKFGQPSALMLDEKTMLLCFWMQSNGKYSIRLIHYQV